MKDQSPPSILAKAFTLLGAFSAERPVMTLSEISRASGLPKSTVHRLLARLIELGAIEQHRSSYRVGMLVLQLGATAPAMRFRDVASPTLTTLFNHAGLAVHLGLLRQFEVVILDEFSRSRSSAPLSALGTFRPANCSALGKALLAGEQLDGLAAFLPTPLPSMTPASITDVEELLRQLAKVQVDGIARDVGEAQQGAASIAAPIIVMGSTVGAVSITFAASTIPSPQLEGLLRSAARRIATDVHAALGQGRVDWFPREIDRAPTVPRA